MSVLLNLPSELVREVMQAWCQSSCSLVRCDTAVTSRTIRNLLFLHYTQFAPFAKFRIPRHFTVWPWLNKRRLALKEVTLCDRDFDLDEQRMIVPLLLSKVQSLNLECDLEYTHDVVNVFNSCPCIQKLSVEHPLFLLSMDEDLLRNLTALTISNHDSELLKVPPSSISSH